MNNIKNDIVNKAIKFTRPYRPIEFDAKTGEPFGNWWFDGDKVDKNALIDLCLSIQKLLYGDEEHESNKHKNGKDIQSGKD